MGRGASVSLDCVFFSPSDEAVLVPGSHEVDVAHQFFFFFFLTYQFKLDHCLGDLCCLHGL